MTCPNSELMLSCECTGSEGVLLYSQNIHRRASPLWPSSGQRYGHGPVGPAPGAQAHAGPGALVPVLLPLLLLQAVDEPQGDFIPLLRQQHQQEADADDAGGSQAHDVEYHLLLQEVHS